MALEIRRYTKAELKQLFSNLKNKGITDTMFHMLIDETYNQPVHLRTSGFFTPGGTDTEISWDNATRTLLLTPIIPASEETVYDVNGEVYLPHFSFYVWEGKPVLQKHYIHPPDSELSNPDEIQIPDEEGLYAIFFDYSRENRRYELTYIKNPSYETIAELYIIKAIVAWIYWVPGTGAIYSGDSRHGSEFNPAGHWIEHQTLNSRREIGITITNAIWNGDGSQDNHFQFGISAGALWHGDIYMEMDAVTAPGSLPVWYFDASERPRYTTQTGKKFLNSGLVAYNAGGALVAAQDGYYVLYHLFATNCQFQPHISAMGRSEYENIADAWAAIEAEMRELRADLPHSNALHLGTVIIQTSWDYTNSAKARLISIAHTVETEMSVTGDGSPGNKIRLVGDIENPGPRYFYGTDKGGNKSFYPLPISENVYIVYNETELLAAWNAAVADVGRSATIYIGAEIVLTANREFLRTASDAKITFWGIGVWQEIYIGNYTFNVCRITMRNLAFRTTGQVYVTVDGHYAEFIDCVWRDEQYYSSTFSNMKIAVRCIGTITNNTGKLTFDNVYHVSATSYQINSGNIQPFIIQNAVNWGTNTSRQIYIELFRMEAVLNYDRFSRLLLHTLNGCYVPFKVTGDLTWYYHPDQFWPGQDYIAPHSELLKKGSVDNLRGDYIPSNTLVSVLGIDADNKIRKGNAGTMEFTPSIHGNEKHLENYALETHDHDIGNQVLNFENTLV